MAFNFSPRVVQSGLVLYLDAANPKSYVSGSTAWNDLSPNLITGSLVNGPTFSSANGGSIVFDGVDDYVNCGNSPSLNIISELTVMSWIKLNSLPNVNGNPNIIDKWDWPLDLRVYFLGTEGGYFAASVTRDGSFSNRLAIIDTENPIVGVYYFLALKYDGQTLTLYKNSNIVNTISYPSPYSLFNSLNTETWIGRSRDAGQGGRWISSDVYNVQVYNRALSPTEVLQNYNATKGRFGLT